MRVERPGSPSLFRAMRYNHLEPEVSGHTYYGVEGTIPVAAEDDSAAAQRREGADDDSHNTGNDIGNRDPRLHSVSSTTPSPLALPVASSNWVASSRTTIAKLRDLDYHLSLNN